MPSTEIGPPINTLGILSEVSVYATSCTCWTKALRLSLVAHIVSIALIEAWDQDHWALSTCFPAHRAVRIYPGI